MSAAPGGTSDGFRQRLRRVLAMMMAAVLAPALTLAFGFGVWNIRLHERAIDSGLQNSARLLSLAIDRDVGFILSSVITLAASPFLDAKDFRRFHQQATSMSAPFDGWVVLTDRSGQQLVNTRRMFGEPLATTSAPDLIASVFSEGEPVVSNVFYSQVAGREIVTVLVPVFRDGIVVYCLSMALEPERFSKLLAEQQLPEQWYAVVEDAADLQIARSLEPEHYSKVAPPAWFIAGTKGKIEGIVQGRGLGGYDVRVAFYRSSFTGWTAGVASPVGVVTQARARILVAGAAGALACLALACAAALLAENTIASMMGVSSAAAARLRPKAKWRTEISARRSARANPPR